MGSLCVLLCRLHGMQEKRDMDTALASRPSQRAVHEMEVNCVTCTHIRTYVHTHLTHSRSLWMELITKVELCVVAEEVEQTSGGEEC